MITTFKNHTKVKDFCEVSYSDYWYIFKKYNNFTDVIKYFMKNCSTEKFQFIVENKLIEKLFLNGTLSKYVFKEYTLFFFKKDRFKLEPIKRFLSGVKGVSKKKIIEEFKTKFIEDKFIPANIVDLGGEILTIEITENDYFDIVNIGDNHFYINYKGIKSCKKIISRKEATHYEIVHFYL